MEARRAPLTEEDIRERVALRHQHLADVRTLSLPGTYHEKITHLGSSLKNFVRLKSLDLSRNALTSLEGLHHLTSLEKLNLYFNHISTLSEVFRLQTLTALQEVDLRLNPVIKNESDYRLFVVHMLPNLRRLDDRPVRDRERKASLLHFTPEQAYEFKKPPDAPKEPEAESTPVPSRPEYIYSLSKKCSVMDEDDEAVLNLIAKCEWDLSKPAGVTGSTQRDPEVQFHVSHKCRHLPDSPMSSAAVSQKSSISMTFLEAKTQEWPKRDPHLMFCDEAQTCDKVRGQAHFTPHPGVNELCAASEKKKRHHRRGREPPEHVQNNQDMPQAAPPLPNMLLVEEASMECLLDLVDKYWNGCRSLHCNEEFLSQAGTLLSAIQKGEAVGQQQPLPAEHQALSHLLLEKKILQEHLFEREEQHNARVKSLKAELSSTKKDLDTLKQHLHQVLEENEALKASCAKAKENASSTDAANAQQLQITKLQDQTQLLTKENAGLKQRLQHFSKLQELTQMLQESHKTLVSTNERLLRELDEARSRHKVEVEELHWSYNQLKKTIDQLPSDKVDSSKS
ncbi:centrosomal protein of 72 kDa [Eublepharis macularius]|uniref:Centrosomal protein of 72 kDa n=1 Tax=Eublepharis macularius TaxID=481883 RepID=A0AA97K2L1_EUBMA|nr:centrosomal protein of 72 kDa [Eublepharis macularius]